uniref:Protein Wnt n=1 Tax=Perionyx excavatus TaxID=168854 RepID=D5LLN1_9ANNE|nr:WNT10 [Perionyx excavatus]
MNRTRSSPVIMMMRDYFWFRHVGRFLRILLTYNVFRRTLSLSNEVLHFPSPENDLLDTGIICKTYPGLTHAQYVFCRRNPDASTAAVQGLHLAVRECQWQFQGHRWNCSFAENNLKNPFHMPILSKGYRESSFTHAILAAGMVAQISRACAYGNLRSCGCRAEVDQDSGLWKWTNCETNLEFADRFTRRFLDKRKLAKDLTFQSHFHNSRVGRKVVKSNSRLHCKCHGMSGSCQMKTCWKVAPSLRKVGNILKRKYNHAVLVDGDNSVQVVLKPKTDSVIRKADIVYFEKSPNFCDPDASMGIPGTSGRYCNRSSTQPDGCETLCCGRGYNTLSLTTTNQCQCQFQWCCHVVCKKCTQTEWVTVCK